MNAQRVFLLEFNELCPSLLKEFMDRGFLPNFRRLYESSIVLTTDAGEKPPHLEPWIQWPTVHTGTPYADHGAFHLGDGRRITRKGVAELLSDAGIPVGVLGSMNMNYTSLHGYVVPDPWDPLGQACPEWLETFYRTVADQVQESSRTKSDSKRQMLQFGWFLANHGLTSGSVCSVVTQLFQERYDPGIKWRRASLLEHLQYDLFRYLNRRFNIRFATFFANSTAHYQHYYWRNMEPERFAVPPLEVDHPSLREAIEYGYRSMDKLLGRFLIDYPDVMLVLVTALSQQPWVETTKCTYRPNRFEELLRFAGISPEGLAIKPVMAEEFHVECPDEPTTDRVKDALSGLSINGEPLMKVDRSENTLFGGCNIQELMDMDQMVSRSKDGAMRRFGDLFYMVHCMRSGRHHPDGALWIRTGCHRVVEQRVPLTAIAPTILERFGVPQPDYMLGHALAVESDPAVATTN
ncbi:hypothetical protein AB1L88_13805 [Tautonia sp. JC769]|uniref:hypothetical protein n=1 Tax=Tautonia sp. JC769 TaxID=3232135 RepID=UPI0034583BC7